MGVSLMTFLLIGMGSLCLIYGLRFKASPPPCCFGGLASVVIGFSCDLELVPGFGISERQYRSHDSLGSVPISQHHPDRTGLSFLQPEFFERPEKSCPAVMISSFLVASIFGVFLLTDNSHHGFIQKYFLVSYPGFNALGKTFGFGFWIYIVYTYLTIAIGILILLWNYYFTNSSNRNQTKSIFLAPLIPLVVNTFQILGLNPVPQYQLGALSFGLFTLITTWDLERLRKKDVIRTSKEKTLDLYSGPAFLIFGGSDVIDLNTAALNLLDTTRKEVVGRPVLEVSSELYHQTLPLLKGSVERAEVRMHRADLIIRFRASSTQLGEKDEQPFGQLLILNPLTDRHRVEDDLERSLVELRDQQDISTALISLETLPTVMNRVAKSVAVNYGFDVVFIGQFHPEMEILRGLAFYPQLQNETHKKALKLLDAPGISGRKIELPYERAMSPVIEKIFDGEVVLGDKLADYLTPWVPPLAARTVARHMHINACIALPFTIHGRLVGAIFATSQGEITTHQRDALLRVATQAAVAVENDRLYSAEKSNVRLLEHSHTLVRILNKIAHRLTTNSTPQEVFDTLGTELHNLYLGCIVMELDQGNEEASLRYISSADRSDLVRLLNKKGLNLINFRISRDKWPPEAFDVLVGKRPLFIPHFPEFILKFKAHLPAPVVKSIPAQIKDTEAALVMPLVNENSVIGSLIVWGAGLQETDLETYSIFSNQVASAYARSSLLQRMREQTDELKRSNSMVNALDRVSAYLSATQDPDEILSRLGKEFSELGMECLVSLIKPDRDIIYIHYISYNNQILRMVEKITGISLSNYLILRSTWPEPTLRVFDHNEAVYLEDYSDVLASYFPNLHTATLKNGLKFLGISAETSAFYLPLANEGLTYGSLTIWGNELKPSDLAAYSVFAGQVSSAFEAARLLNRAQEEIRERQKVQDALENSQKEYRGLFENAHDAILILDPCDQKILEANSRACEIYGYSREDFVGRSITKISENPKRSHDLINETLESGEYHHFETAHIRADGSRMELEINASVVQYRGRKAIQSIHRDITSRKTYEKKLRYDALHDGLTDLPNRELFLDRLGHAIARATRHPEEKFAVIYMDIDQFKMINDSLGHLIGDEYLQEIASRLQSLVRAADIVARIGGDEFTILLDDLDDIYDATLFVKRAQNAIRVPVELKGHTLVTTASFGVVISDPRYSSAEDYLRDADIAMYRAKDLGKARHEIFDESMHSQVMKKVRLEGMLRRAFLSDEFSIRYQPIISLPTRSAIGFEALLRWQTREDGWISPGEFIPVAEDTGLIQALGFWVMRNACEKFQVWRRIYSDENLKTLNINVSGIQLISSDFPAKVSQILDSTGINPEWLTLEITESAIIMDTDAAELSLEALKTLGIQIALDDFGTGFSSLSFLSRFPIDSIKIDRKFIMELNQNNHAGLVRTMISMGRELGLKVIAEGIEDQIQLQLLEAMGCTLGQGFFLSIPLEHWEIEEQLEKTNGLVFA